MIGKKLVFLGMGGTIAGKAARADDLVGYQAGSIALSTLLEDIPSLTALLQGHDLVMEQVAQIDSKDVDFEDWKVLLARVVLHLADPEVCSVLVTHGTDTLEETAYLLSRAVPARLLQNKSVVMTCAMRPATALGADGPQNIVDACAVALDAKARGVLVVCAAYVHAAQYVQKVHTYRLDAFDSADAGPLALVEAGRVRWLQAYEMPQALAPLSANLWERLQRSEAWPRVEIVMSYAGVDGALVRALCEDQKGPALQGLVVAGTGNGTIHKHLQAALLQVQEQGVRVVRASRCAYGAVVAGNNPVPPTWAAWPLSAVKARIELMLTLVAER